MTEDVLQYIWQQQTFNKTQLSTRDQEPLKIFSPGQLNTSSGPDFSEAQLQIGEVTWAGDVEIHIYSSHWDNHRHNLDHAYDKVILHVVWEDDGPVFRRDGTSIPTLELKARLDPDWYGRYQHLMKSLSAIPCENYLPAVDSLVIFDARQSALVQRLEAKASEVMEVLHDYRGDWERTAINWLFTGFGFQKNKAAFQQLAKIVDLAILRKLNSGSQLAAYLFGLSGLLPSKSDEAYTKELIKEFAWQQKKFNLSNKTMSLTWWKFMRMRPANFPTLRIAQLATLLRGRQSILRTLLDSDTEELRTLFNLPHHEFWQSHYHFNSWASRKLSGMGRQSQDNLLINVVAVLLVAYGTARNQAKYIKKAISLLEVIQPESNKITRVWQSLGITPQNAAESQGLIGLFNDYCKKSRCLSCSIGKYIIDSQ